MRQRNVRPTHPGEFIKEDFLKPLGMTQRQLAEKTGYELKAINRLVNGHCSVTADMAIALEKALGMPAYFWLEAQNRLDLFEARQRLEQKQASSA